MMENIEMARSAVQATLPDRPDTRLVPISTGYQGDVQGPLTRTIELDQHH